jgi:predicted transcriptional regulator
MAPAAKPMTFHLPQELRDRLEAIAERQQRSLTKQMIVMLAAEADRIEKEEKSGG